MNMSWAWGFELRIRTFLFAIGLGLFCSNGDAGDWPAYQHDNARSGASKEVLPTELAEAWAHVSAHEPHQAWPGPAKWDGWNKVYNLKDRMIFDKAFQVAAVGDAVYFGSSSDDQVYCLDAQTGAVRWTFYTEGPVRLAPSVSDGHVYVGSDDGYVYCLDAQNGQLVWKHRPGPADRRVPGNGRIVSVWAIRSGVVRVDDTVYACAGVFPSETVYVCAMNAHTGEEIWKTETKEVPAQGYLLASGTRLYVTTGRSTPVVLNRATGKFLYQAKGGSTGGTFALLTGDQLLYGPGKTGQMAVVGADNPDHLAAFDGNHMIVTPAMSYLHTDTQLSALDRNTYIRLYSERKKLYARARAVQKELKKVKGKKAAELTAELKSLAPKIEGYKQPMRECVKWKASCRYPFSLILAGNKLYAGGAGEVAAFDPKNGEQVWRGEILGNAYGLAVANGRLFVSTDRGTIHCFTKTSQAENTESSDLASSSAAPAPEIEELETADAIPAFRPNTRGSYDVVHGPFLEFVAPETVEVSWQTTEPTTSIVDFGRKGKRARRYENGELATEHHITVRDVAEDAANVVRVGGQTEAGQSFQTAAYDFDSTFEYLPVSTPEHPSPFDADVLDAKYDRVAQAMLDEVGHARGYALLIGAGDGCLAYSLAKQTDMRIIVADTDADRVARVRRLLSDAGLYGPRVAVHLVSSFDRLPYGDYFANLVAIDPAQAAGPLSVPAESVFHVLRPAGGVAFLGGWSNAGAKTLSQESIDAWAGAIDLDPASSRFVSVGGRFWVHRRSVLEGAGDWSHQYGSPDNSACSQDDLVRGDLAVLWWGRPGPRPMPDRGPRNPAPVSKNGRLFVQGNRTLFGLDQYNGTILWSKQIPTMRRANVPRDGSNMVASDDFLYVVIRDVCVGFQAGTGERTLNFPVAQPDEQQPLDWGYIACVDETLVGSTVKRGSQYIGDDGEWFEDFKPNEIDRVTSTSLFALDRHSGEGKWTYDRGVIMNSTITVADGLVYFVESTNEQAKSQKTGRLFDLVQKDQRLVAIDLETGEVRWENPYDFSKCQFMTYMSYGQNTLIVLGSDKDKVFHTYAFDSRTGYPLWQNDSAAKKTHHSGQLAHPTIIGDKIYVNKQTYELSTGNVIATDDFKWHGCGVMSASKHTIFHRFEFHGMLDLHTNKRTEFLGIRSGCWLSLIPSGGVLLAPETSAGCSCGHPIQTSIAYVPRTKANEPGAKP